jgi:tol-pal system protein YbgF
MGPRVLVPLLAAALAVPLPGCDRQGEERQLDEMAQEIDHLQVDRDDADKKVLPDEAADTHFSEVPGLSPAPGQPPPPTVNLSADGTPPPPEMESPDTEDPSPRPTIRVVGSPRQGRDFDTSVVDDGTAQPAHSSALDPEAKHAYDAALALVNAKQYDRALDAFAAFLVKWPDHPYADNATFWRGECYFARGDWLHAAEQFEGVVTRFPTGNKAPDALLELGRSELKLGDPDRAKQYFDRLAQQFPQSEAAHKIPPVPVQAATPPGPRSEDPR